jgi:hypothetical protein
MKKNIYPKNRAHFKKLIPFAKKILFLCKSNKISATIYGSFAHFYNTKDENMKVNDIDLIIPKKDFPQAVELLKKKKINFRYIAEYPGNGMSTIIIKKGKLKVEIDETGGDYKTLRDESLLKNTQKIDFYGIPVNMVTLKQLENIYVVAYKRSKEDKTKILMKIKHLESFLKRKLR